ncbi:enoyl-CoA hydratase/isomerase family protein [Actinomadura sp. HBU206391]|uniref:enoyl-CoA hydratase/isomerase family protein n=1 Tax=Actinomadura sp. HBU206391 TaxID=2731692 RepID=UPI00164F1B4F|nr:enoyl-CoA hydratase/isomerase family protein [Actinomadura sp. HBU206391]MBC6458190.1 enoyl-CoA hydratase/isomerase family protein [Actinomadura sp. HBU206391]
MFDLQRDGDVHVLRFDDDENRFTPAFLDGFHEVLDTLEKAEGPGALVTVGTGKFYSNGLDLDWLSAHGDQFEPYVGRIHRMFARLLTLPMPTVAAVNGHAFAGGAMLALAHDFIVMRSDRGYFCLPEVDLGISFTSGMGALIQARLTAATAHEATITGRRYPAEEAVTAGIVYQAVPEAEVLPRAVELAASLAGKDGATVGKIRTGLYGAVIETLTDPAVLD